MEINKVPVCEMRNVELKRDRRNEIIRQEIIELKEIGYKIKDAIRIVSDHYFLSSETVRDIWYGKEKKCKI
jgi:hypothetical protein